MGKKAIFDQVSNSMVLVNKTGFHLKRNGFHPMTAINSRNKAACGPTGARATRRACRDRYP
jgi:hypothetical protein